MKIEFIENTPHIVPENYEEQDLLFDWFEKNRGKQVNAVIYFEWVHKHQGGADSNRCYVHEDA